MKGKLIIIEGTDCSGKQTQTELLVKMLNKMGVKSIRLSAPFYDSPTGQIVGGAYLNKEGFQISSIFPEGAVNVDPKVASLLYATDRLYNVNRITEKLNQDYVVVMDRYVESNLAFQGGRILDDKKRKEMYKFLLELEYGVLGLPKPDYKFLLYMPFSVSSQLKKNRLEKPDEYEKDEEVLKNAEKAYMELVKLYDFIKIDCYIGLNPKSIEAIQKELSEIVLKLLKI